MRKYLPILFFLILSGCEAIPIVGPLVNGLIVWTNGEASKYYAFNSTTLYRTTKKACQEFGYTIESDSSSDQDHYLIVGSNKRFKIKIESMEPEISRLKIRVGFFGDKPYAELIYKKVDDLIYTIDFDSNGYPTYNHNK